MSRSSNVCIVGLGRAGKFHLNSIRLLNHVNLKYVVDPNIIELGSQFEDKTWEGLSSINLALADPDIDSVIIASPTGFHYDYISQSLEAGKNVFTEKPLGETVTEIQHCFNLAHEKKLTLHLGFQRRYDHNFNSLKDQLSSIGQPRILKASSRDNPKPSLDYLSISGNIFHDMLIHDFDMLLYLLGTKIPKSVYAVGRAYDSQIADLKDYDTVLVNIEYEDGLICSIDTSRTSPYGYDQRIEVFGEHGMLMAENESETSTKLFNDQGIHQAKIKHSFPQRYKDCYLRELNQFFENVEMKNSFNVTKEECLIAHVIADAAYDSITSGLPIEFYPYYATAIS